MVFKRSMVAFCLLVSACVGRVAGAESGSARQRHFYMNFPDGSNRALPFPSSPSPQEVLESVEEKYKALPDSFQLKLGDKVLPKDQWTGLKEDGLVDFVVDDAVVRLVPFQKLDELCLFKLANPKNKLSQLKGLIEEKLGIRQADQIILCPGLEAGDEEKSLEQLLALGFKSPYAFFVVEKKQGMRIEGLQNAPAPNGNLQGGTPLSVKVVLGVLALANCGWIFLLLRGGNKKRAAAGQEGSEEVREEVR